LKSPVGLPDFVAGAEAKRIPASGMALATPGQMPENALLYG
jgi:hypothetical protein